MFEVLAPEVGFEPTTLRLTAVFELKKRQQIRWVFNRFNNLPSVVVCTVSLKSILFAVIYAVKILRMNRKLFGAVLTCLDLFGLDKY